MKNDKLKVPVLMKQKANSDFNYPETASYEDQFQFVCTIMDMIEDANGELSFSIDCTVGGFSVEIYESGDSEDEDKELIDWYRCRTIKEVFVFLVEKYL